VPLDRPEPQQFGKRLTCPAPARRESWRYRNIIKQGKLAEVGLRVLGIAC